MRLAAAFAVVCFTAGTARAEDEDYTAPVVLTDAVGDVLLVAGLGMSSRHQEDSGDLLGNIDLAGMGVTFLAIGTLALGGPIVHIAHGEPDRALLDLLLRIGLPVGGGIAVCKPTHEASWCGIGAFVGLVAAEALDWFWLTRLDVGDAEPAAFMLRAASGAF